MVIILCRASGMERIEDGVGGGMIHADTIGAAYWEERATTAEEKVKDWSARAVEAEARIRELEAEVDRLEACESQSILRGQIVGDYGQRIAKAKAILEHHHVRPGEGNICPACRALEALEGK